MDICSWPRDNGLLGSLIAAADQVEVRQVEEAGLRKLGIEAPSATFHGRDIFAPVGAELAAGNTTPAQLGRALDADAIVPSWIEDAALVRGEVKGTVITFDHFGNIITNVDEHLIDAMKKPVVRVGGHDFELRRTYGEVKPGEYLALVNSFGVVEIARAESSAHDGLGAERGAPVVVRDDG